jgi:hypothetical protein
VKWAQRAAGGVARRASRQYLRSSQASEPSQSQRSWLQPLAQGYPNCDPRRPLHPCRSSCRSLLGIAYAVPVGVASAVAFDWYYIPPTHPSAVPGPEETAALAVYLLNLTGVLLAELATHARRRAKRFLQGPVFAEIAENDDAFAELFFDAERGTVCWPNGADIAPETLLGLPEVGRD